MVDGINKHQTFHSVEQTHSPQPSLKPLVFFEHHSVLILDRQYVFAICFMFH